MTELHDAAESGDLNKSRKLIDDVNAKDWYEETPLLLGMDISIFVSC